MSGNRPPDGPSPPNGKPSNVVPMTGVHERSKAAGTARAKSQAAWRARLTLDKAGNVKSTLANATLVLQHDPAWDGVLGYDERSEEPVFLMPPPFLDGGIGAFAVPRGLADSDDVRTAQWLEERHGITIGLAQVHAAMNAVAATAPFDRVREYLNGLHWDGVDRLGHWLSDFLGADYNAYTHAVGTRWLISAVARTFEPGCKADHVLVFEGEQGSGKSTALRVLAGDAHFGDDVPAIGSKDAQQYLGPLWVIELAEMDAASKAESATLKRFLTTSEDRYRPPYGRRMIKHRRRCVFAGTVNLEEYLRDSTGGRRFWPVACRAVHVEGLRAMRDALWAEAVHRYRAGESWYLDDPELERLAAEQQSRRLEGDPWEDSIRTYLSRPNTTFVTCEELLSYAIKMEIPRMTKADRNRVGAIMRKMNWRYGEGDARQRGWRRP